MLYVLLITLVSAIAESRVFVGYYGDMGTHPGLTISFEQTLKEYSVVDIKIKEELFFYFHPQSHKMFGFDISLPLTFYKSANRSISLNPGIGYIYKVTGGDGVYYRNSAGELEMKSPEGMHRLGINMGINLRFLSFYFEPKIKVEYPENSGALIHPILSLGATYEK